MKRKLPHQELIPRNTDYPGSFEGMDVSCPDVCGNQTTGQTQGNQESGRNSHMAKSVTRHALNPSVVKIHIPIIEYTERESAKPPNSLPEKAELYHHVLRMVESSRESVQGCPAYTYISPLNGQG